MELVTKKTLRLYSGRSHPALADDIAGHLGVPLGEANVRDFPNGEIHCRFGENIRGADVFIIQTHCGSVNDSIMEHLIMIDAAKRASAKRITAVCPLFGYARQDRKAEGREPIAAKLVADLLTAAGASRMLASICTPVRSKASSTSRSTTSPRCRCCSSTSRTSAVATSSSSRRTPAE